MRDHSKMSELLEKSNSALLSMQDQQQLADTIVGDSTASSRAMVENELRNSNLRIGDFDFAQRD